jgi:hypothetical protein
MIPRGSQYWREGDMAGFNDATGDGPLIRLREIFSF